MRSRSHNFSPTLEFLNFARRLPFVGAGDGWNNGMYGFDFAAPRVFSRGRKTFAILNGSEERIAPIVRSFRELELGVDGRIGLCGGLSFEFNLQGEGL